VGRVNSPVTGNGDSRRIAEKLLRQLKTNKQTNKSVKCLWLKRHHVNSQFCAINCTTYCELHLHFIHLKTCDNHMFLIVVKTGSMHFLYEVQVLWYFIKISSKYASKKSIAQYTCIGYNQRYKCVPGPTNHFTKLGKKIRKNESLIIL
jgi:hypothetical protein